MSVEIVMDEILLPFSLRVFTVSRHACKNASATKKFIYIARRGRYKNRSSELSKLCSGNMPKWVIADEIEFWKAADEHTRSNGVLCRLIVFKLPVVLSEDQKVALTEKFVEAVTGEHKFPYVYGIHQINGANPHVHLIFSECKTSDGVDRTREKFFKKANKKNPKKGGAPKAMISSMQKKYTKGEIDWLGEIRKLWEDLANEALKKAGRPERIDRRSLEEQDDDRIAYVELGKGAIEMEKRGVKTEKGKLNELLGKLNRHIKLIKEIKRSNDFNYIVSKFSLKKFRDDIEKNSRKLSIEDIQKIVGSITGRIEERAETDVPRISYEIGRIKEIKETIKRNHPKPKNRYENDPKARIFPLVRKTVIGIEKKIAKLENNMRRLYTTQKEWIEYFIMELSDYLEEPYLEKEIRKYHFSLYIKDGKNNKIIGLTKEKTLAEQYPNRVAIAKNYGQINQTEVKQPVTFRPAEQIEVKNFPVEAKEADTAEKIKQKDDQKIPPVVLGEYKSDTKDTEKSGSGTTEKDAQEIPPMPKIVHEDDKVRIKEFKKDDIAFLTVGVNQKNGNWELKEGHLVDKNDFEINSEGRVKRKGIEEEAVAPLPNLTKKPDTKQVTTTEKTGQKDAQEIPPMPKVVYEDDKVRIKEFKKDDIAFLTVGVNKKNGNWELKEGYLVDKNDFEVNSEGRVKRKGIEEEAVAPLPNLTLKPDTKQVEDHLVDEDVIVKEAENGEKEGEEISEELKKEERLEDMPIGEFMGGMRGDSNLNDKKTKTEQSKTEQFEQSEVKQLKINQTKGLEDEQEEDERKKARKKKAKKDAREKTEATELDGQAKTNETENGQNKNEQDGTEQPKIEQDDEAVSDESTLEKDNKKLMDGIGPGKDGPDEDGLDKGSKVKTTDEPTTKQTVSGDQEPKQVVSQGQDLTQQPGAENVVPPKKDDPVIPLTDIEKRFAEKSRTNPKKLYKNQNGLKEIMARLEKQDRSYVVLESLRDPTVIKSFKVDKKIINQIQNPGKDKGGPEM